MGQLTEKMAHCTPLQDGVDDMHSNNQIYKNEVLSKSNTKTNNLCSMVNTYKWINIDHGISKIEFIRFKLQLPDKYYLKLTLSHDWDSIVDENDVLTKHKLIEILDDITKNQDEEKKQLQEYDDMISSEPETFHPPQRNKHGQITKIPSNTCSEVEFSDFWSLVVMGYLRNSIETYNLTIPDDLMRIIITFYRPFGITKILNNNEKFKLHKEVCKQLRKHEIYWRLIYRATDDGFDCDAFWSKCNSKGNVIVIIKTMNDNIFGGYTSCNFEKKYGKLHVRDEDAFLFSVKSNYYIGDPFKYKPQIFPINKHCCQYALYYDPEYLFCFGYNGNGIQIISNCNVKESKSFGISYETPTIYPIEKHFKTAEIEIFQLWYGSERLITMNEFKAMLPRTYIKRLGTFHTLSGLNQFFDENDMMKESDAMEIIKELKALNKNKLTVGIESAFFDGLSTATIDPSLTILDLRIKIRKEMFRNCEDLQKITLWTAYNGTKCNDEKYVSYYIDEKNETLWLRLEYGKTAMLV